MSFWGSSCLILGRIREARLEVWEVADDVCSVRMVVLCAMQELDEKMRLALRLECDMVSFFAY